MASGSILSAQFINLPAGTEISSPGYQPFVDSIGYDPFTGFDPSDTAGWTEPVSFVPWVDYHPTGLMNIFFIGKDASWNNSLGVSLDIGDRLTGDGRFDPNMTFTGDDFHLFNAGTSTLGNYVQVNLGDMDATFDFWLSTGSTNHGWANAGGIWSPTNSDYNNPDTGGRFQARQNVVFSNGNPYHIIGIEDMNLSVLDPASDGDFDDFVFGIQFLGPDGTPFNPVPEPSTYGMFGILALLGVISLRRFKKKNA